MKEVIELNTEITKLRTKIEELSNTEQQYRNRLFQFGIFVVLNQHFRVFLNSLFIAALLVNKEQKMS